jgi:hypothetical protein
MYVNKYTLSGTYIYIYIFIYIYQVPRASRYPMDPRMALRVEEWGKSPERGLSGGKTREVWESPKGGVAQAVEVFF